MGTNVFYNMVKEYAESFLQQRPDCAVGDNAICAVFTSKHDIFTGVTGMSQSVSAEHLAINSMCEAEQTKARQIITLSLSDFSVIKPNADGIAKMIEVDAENEKCEVFISQNESVKAIEIVGITSSAEQTTENFYSDFDSQADETETVENNAFESTETVSEVQSEPEAEPVRQELGSPADFSSGFDIDITNPFYEAPAKDKEVTTIASASPRKPVNNFSGNSAGNSTKTAPVMSKDELLKQAKKKKKIAKNIFSAKRK